MSRLRAISEFIIFILVFTNFDCDLKPLGKVPKTSQGGGVQKMGEGLTTFMKNGGSVDGVGKF